MDCSLSEDHGHSRTTPRRSSGGVAPGAAIGRDQQQGAAANHATAPRRLPRHLRRHQAAFGVWLPPASGSFLVLNGPRTLRGLRHAPISSALSPNRYRTIPSSARTWLLICAATACRSALAPT